MVIVDERRKEMGWRRVVGLMASFCPSLEAKKGSSYGRATVVLGEGRKKKFNCCKVLVSR